MTDTTREYEFPPLKDLKPVSIMTTMKKPLQDCEILSFQTISKQTLRNTQYRDPSDLAEDAIIIRNGPEQNILINQRDNFYLLQEKPTSVLLKETLKNLSIGEDEFNPKEMNKERISKSFNSFKKREANKQDKECSDLLEEFFTEDPNFMEEDANQSLKKQDERDKMLVQRTTAKITEKLGKKYSKEYLQGLILKQEQENARTEKEIMMAENEIDRLKIRFNLQN